MELTQKQLREISEQVSDGQSLEEVLSKFPNTTIAIIRGYDNFSYESYTKDAYFSEEQARRSMDEIKPNGSLPDTYHVVTGTILELEQGKISDRRTRRILDEIDVRMVYSHLESHL
jgi:hypothetical protein